MTLEERIEEERQRWIEEQRALEIVRKSANVRRQIRQERIDHTKQYVNEKKDALTTRIKSFVPKAVKASVTAAVLTTLGISLWNLAPIAYNQASDYISQAVPTVQHNLETQIDEADATARAFATRGYESFNRRYVTLDLEKISRYESPIGISGLSAGEHELHNVPFKTGWPFATACSGDDMGWRSDYTIMYDVEDPLAVYILITAGSALKQYEGETIGAVALEFTEEDSVVEPLVLGHNIRSYLMQENLVNDFEASNVFVGHEEFREDELYRTIDVLRIDIPSNMGDLSAIKIIDYQWDVEEDPCLWIGGITVERDIGQPRPTPRPVPTATPSLEQKSLDYTGWKKARQAPFENVTVDLDKGDVLFVSGTRFKVGDEICEGGYPQICVYMEEAETSKTLDLENLVPGQTWIAVTDQLSLEEVYRSRMPAYWIAPNCGTGCSVARIHKEGEIIYAQKDAYDHLVSLEEAAQDVPDFVEFDRPKDISQMGGVWFDMRNRTLTQCVNEMGSQPETLTLGVDADASEVYLLMQAGHGYYTLDKMHFGYVELAFESGIVMRKDLIMGQSIRDWSRNRSNAVNTLDDPDVYEVWRGQVIDGKPDEMGLEAGLDMMRISIPEGYGALKTISVVDRSQESYGYNPCVQLYGVTVRKNGEGS